MVSFHLIIAASSLIVAPVWGNVNYQAPEFASEDGFLDVVLNISMEFSLNGTRFSPHYNVGPVGPTLRVRPGDLLTVTLNNNLPPSPAGDIELLRYIQDPQNEIDEYINVTKIYNRLDEIGNVQNPEFGYWGFNLANLHFHGAGFPPSLEDLQHPLDGGESRTFKYRIPEDHPPGLVWYHSHVHGVGEYEMMSGLFGAMIIEGTANDVTVIPEIGNATEVIMIMSEALMDSETSIPLPFFPLVLAFGWSSVVNGILAEETKFEFRQGETVLFRTVSAGVEPTIRLYFNESNSPDFLIVSEDGFPVPELKSTDVVPLPSGSRAEFMVKFDVPGTFQLRRKAWNGHSGEMHGMEACGTNADHASRETTSEKCVSYDVDKLIATVTILDATPPLDSQLPSNVPEYHPVYKAMAEMPVTKRREIRLEVKVGFPIFQIPYSGSFVPPGTGFAINGRLLTPHYRHGKIINGTCEEWTVISDPGKMEHSFHIHTNPFLVTHEDGIPVSEPFWRDAHAVFGDNITIKTCFNHLQPGDYVLVHCHQMSHVGVGMGAYFSVVDGTMNETDGLEVDYPDEGSEEVLEPGDAEGKAQEESTASSWAPLLLRVLFDLKLASLGMCIFFS